MYKKTVVTSKVIVAGSLILELAIAIACRKQNVTQVPKTTPSSNLPMRLNLEEVGTTNDTSRLEAALGQIIEQRRKNGAYRPGTTELEDTVYLWPEPSLKIPEVARVSEVVRSKIPVRPEVVAVAATQGRPDPMTLVLFLGSPKSKPPVNLVDFKENSSNDHGIGLIFDLEITVKHSAAETEGPLKQTLTIEIPRDGQYLVDLKPVDQADLRAAIQQRRSEKSPPANTIVAVASDVSWSSLAVVAEAAYPSGIRGFEVVSLVP